MLRTAPSIIIAIIELILVLAVILYLYRRYLNPTSGPCAWIIWIERRWATVVPVITAVIATAWDSILDVIILIIHAFPDTLRAFSTLDLTPLQLPEMTRILLLVTSAAITAIQAARVARRTE